MNLNGTIKKTQALSGRLVKSSGGGGSVQEIYWVQYGVGTATNAEVNEAVAANKLPICYWDSTNAYGQTTRRLYFLIRHTPTEALFATVDSTNETIIVRRLYADEWNTQTIRYEGKLTWDQTPRFGSVNPVTSGGIYNALQNATVSDERIAEAVDDWMDANVPSIGTLSYAAKQALLNCFAHVAWIDDQGQSYYNALESELFPDATLESITAVFTQGSAVIYDSDSLDALRQYLVVTATFSDSTTATVTDYTLSGTLTDGTSTITVSYGGKTTDFNVAVTGWTLAWDYNDNDMPVTVAPNDWEYIKYGSQSVGFVSGKGIHWSGNSGYIQLRPKNYITNANCICECVVEFESITDYSNFVIRESNGTDGSQVSVQKNGIRMFTNDATPISGTNTAAGQEYIFRCEYDSQNVKVYRDGTLIFTGTPSTAIPAKRNEVMISTTANSGATFAMNIKAVRYKFN